MNWFRRAAVQGYANAQRDLGFCYENGQGVSKDAKEAVSWYRKAANQGYADAQCNLGMCYVHGQGVSKIQKKRYPGIAKRPIKDM